MRLKVEDREIFSPDERQSNVEVWLGRAPHTYADLVPPVLFCLLNHLHSCDTDRGELDTPLLKLLLLFLYASCPLNDYAWPRSPPRLDCGFFINSSPVGSLLLNHNAFQL